MNSKHDNGEPWTLFAIALVVSILLTAFFQTQVVHGEHYARRSDENRLQPISVPARRGRSRIATARSSRRASLATQ